MHSFPSVGDAANIWKSVKHPDTPILVKILATPLVGLIYLCAIGSVVWLDFLYGMAVACLSQIFWFRLLPEKQCFKNKTCFIIE